MGIDSDRVVVSSRNAARRNLSCSNSESISKKRELSKLSSEMVKKPSNKTAKSAVCHYNKSPVEVNCKQKAPKRSFNRSETEKWNMDYIKGDKSFSSLNSLESVVPKSSRSLNEVFPRKAKTSISSDKTPKWSEQDNSVNFSFSYPHSPYSTSRNHLNIHSSSSAASLSSGESPNSVLWKKGNSSISKNINSPSGCKGESILSFGNIYRSPSRGRDLQRNNTFPSYKNSSVDCKESRIIQPNARVLGLGGCNYGHGNIIKSTKSCWSSQVSSRELKDAGNEEYRRSRFLEAISLYDKAIALNPQNAPCHYNKAAALAGLGRYANAVGECLEAIKCDPSYKLPHHRLGTIYTRLGRVEDAKWHFELSGQQPGSDSMKNIVHLEAHLLNMKKAQQLEDWNHVLSESNLAIKAGADASNQVLSYKAEALLKLHRAKEALEVLIEARELQGTRSRKMHRGDSCLLIIESQIYMYLGRFDDGVKAAEQAVNMDSGLKSLMWLRKAQAIADARRKGNEHFKAEKYLEACEAYGQGLEHAPLNSALLTNRAACWSKLGQWEKAIKDCTSALENRPDYTKPLLWRAHSYAKLVRWEESVRDYKTLNQLRPGDRSIAHSLYQVELELKMAQQRVCDSRRNVHITHVNVRSQFLNPIKLTV